MTTLTFGNVTAPLVEHHDMDPGWNTAWDDLGPRRALFVVLHSTYGGAGWSGLMGTEGYFLGDARARARTDYGLDNVGGRIVRWTDPLSRQSGYASGPYQLPSGDAPALVAKLGVYAINRDGISVEVAGGGSSPVSDVAFENMANLVAFWADYNAIPHDVWPINPKTGVTFVYWHGEFNGEKRTTCPNAAVRARTESLIVRVRAILKAAQTAAVETAATPPVVVKPAPVPTPVPAAPPTALLLPPGVNLAMVQGWFGKATSNGDKAMTFSFDPNGILTKLWLARGKRLGVWPQLSEVTQSGNARVFRFSDGFTVIAEGGKLREVSGEAAA